MGFLTDLNINDIQNILVNLITNPVCPGLSVHERMRLSVTVCRYPHPIKKEKRSWDLTREYSQDFSQNLDALVDELQHITTNTNIASGKDTCRDSTSHHPLVFHSQNVENQDGLLPICHESPVLEGIKHAVPTETFHVLNEVVVDRGSSAYMSQLELFCDQKHLTTVQADGLVLSTPTGSTAYSLSAGGSLVHPLVPSILVTPICPHSLSFRPMLVPDSVELRVQVPLDSRSIVCASFDGKHRIELNRGDAIVVTRSCFPMKTVSSSHMSLDWFQSLSRCLHWNERTRQSNFSIQEEACLDRLRTQLYQHV